MFGSTKSTMCRLLKFTVYGFGKGQCLGVDKKDNGMVSKRIIPKIELPKITPRLRHVPRPLKAYEIDINADNPTTTHQRCNLEGALFVQPRKPKLRLLAALAIGQQPW